MSSQNNTNMGRNNSFQANIQQPHGSSQNTPPYPNYYIGNNNCYYYGDQRQFHLRGPPYPATFAPDGNAAQQQGGHPLQLSGISLKDLKTTDLQVECGFSSPNEPISAIGLPHQPNVLFRGIQHPPNGNFVAGFENLYSVFESSFASPEMARSYCPTNTLPWHISAIDHQNGHRDLEEHPPSEQRSGQTAYGPTSEHTAHINEDVTYADPTQNRQALGRQNTPVAVEQTIKRQEESQEAGVASYRGENQEVFSISVAGIKNQLAPQAPASSASVSASTIHGPADVTSRKTNRKPKFQVLADVLPTPLPNFPQVQLYYPTRIDACKNFRERVKLQPTYWTPPENDASIPQSDADRQNVVRILVGAMKDLSRVRDIESQSSESRWVANAPRKHEDEDIEIACWEIAELTERLHREGPSVLEIRDAKFQDKVKSSANLTFQQRIHFIATMLCEFKSRCDGMIKGGSLHTVVGAPQDALHTSRSNLQNNRYRQDLLSFARKYQPEEVTGKRKRPTKESSATPADDSISAEADFLDDEHGFTGVQPSPSPNQPSTDTYHPTLTSQSSSETQRKRIRFSTHEEMPSHSYSEET